MADIEWSDEGGEVAAFRVFEVSKAGGGGRIALTALSTGYVWGAGPQAARCHIHSSHQAMSVDESGWAWDWDDPDRIPVVACSCGFWGYKSYRGLQRYLGSRGHVLGLVEMWGKIVPAEVGVRAEFAEISAIVRPHRVDDLDSFPDEAIREGYPGVRVVNLGEVSSVIKERKLRLLRREPAPAQNQWISPTGDLLWLRDVRGADAQSWGVRLPVAAEYPGETLPEHGLVKVRYRDDEVGKMYAYWRRNDGERDSRREDRRRFHEALGGGGMGHHIEEEADVVPEEG